MSKNNSVRLIFINVIIAFIIVLILTIDVKNDINYILEDFPTEKITCNFENISVTDRIRRVAKQE
jgi:hypothetical protein